MQSKPGFNATGETTVARAGGREIYWEWYWRSKLEQLARDNPGFAVVVKDRASGISFGGVVPPDHNGQRIEEFV